MKNSRFDNNIDHSIYFTLCNGMRDGAAILNATMRKFIYCNKSFLNLFEIDSMDEIDLTLLKKLTKDTITLDLIADRKKTIKEKGAYYELVEYQSLKGHSFFGEATVQLFKSNGVDYYLFVINPIDDAFFEVASMGMIMVNNLGKMVTINHFALQQFGYEKKEVIGKKIEMLLPTHLYQNHIAHQQGFMHQPKNQSIGLERELFAVKKDGTKFPVEVSVGNYATDGHNYLVAFISDISMRKQTEDRLKKLNEKLEFKVEQRAKDLNKTLRHLEMSRNELQKLSSFQKALLDNAGAIIVSVDTNGIIQTFNTEAEKELGYKADELIGKFTPEIYHESSLIKARANELSQELKGNMPAGMELFHAKEQLGLQNENEWMYVRKDGTRFPVRLNVTAMRDEQGTILGYVGAAFNISKTKQNEQVLQQALIKERELGELKSRFVSMASHEFRTPLSTVLSSAYLIEKYPTVEDHPKREKHLQRIVSSVNMLTDILNDFLSMGKIEEGKMHVNPSHFNLPDMINSTLDEMRSAMKNRQNIRYLHKGKPEVFLDAGLLKHIVMNLVSNADKFSSALKPIEITTANNQQRLILSVKDYGMGISKEDQLHLTERFFRGVNAANIQGTGLGLHIVSKYTELMNGTMECKSDLDKGAELVITFKEN